MARFQFTILFNRNVESSRTFFPTPVDFGCLHPQEKIMLEIIHVNLEADLATEFYNTLVSNSKSNGDDNKWMHWLNPCCPL